MTYWSPLQGTVRILDKSYDDSSTMVFNPPEIDVHTGTPYNTQKQFRNNNKSVTNNHVSTGVLSGDIYVRAFDRDKSLFNRRSNHRVGN